MSMDRPGMVPSEAGLHRREEWDDGVVLRIGLMGEALIQNGINGIGAPCDGIGREVREGR